MSIKLVLGLGNPGPVYEGTRHNIGFEVVRKAAERTGCSIDRKRFCGLTGNTRFNGHSVIFLMPQVFVNNSGISALSVLQYFNAPLHSMMVVSDDLSIPVGKIRLRKNGSSGGHNGLKSIISMCQSDRFARLKVGIGNGDGADTVSFVLGRPGAEECEAISRTVETAAEAVYSWLDNGIEKSMNIYN